MEIKKIQVSQIISLFTLLALAGGFIIRYGTLPESFAGLEKKIESYQKDIKEVSKDLAEVKAEQRYVRAKLDDTYELLKKKMT